MIGARDLSVRFDTVLALDGVEIEIAPGTIHALAGQNGSGKSTLLKVLGGVQRPTAGEVVLDGEPISFGGPADAARRGVGMVFQELSLFGHLSGYANIFIGHEPRRFGLLNRRELQARSRALLSELGMPDIDLARAVSELTVAEQQVVEIVKCLSHSPRIILFDEPTASLTSREAVPLLTAMRRLRDQGYTIAFVSHRLEEVFDVADRVTVLRDGQLTWDGATRDLDQPSLLEAMLGRPLDELYPTRRAQPQAEVAVRLEQARCDGLAPVDLEIRAGEIVGLAGAVGSGSSLVAEMIGGLRRVKEGRLIVGDRERKLRNPAAALRAGIAYMPEDRRTDGLFQQLSIATNMSMPLMAADHSPLVARSGFVRRRAERDVVLAGVQQAGVRPPDPFRAAGLLSGGNQQKVVLGRWFLRDLPCLIMNNPTVGIDVGSKAEIYRQIAELADSGHAVIVVSSYNDELLGIADRIAVFREGAIVGSYRRGEVGERELALLTLGAGDDPAPTTARPTGGSDAQDARIGHTG